MLPQPPAVHADERLTLDGHEYVVVGVRGLLHNGHDRQELTLRRPHGHKHYFAVRYENGTYSSVTKGP